MVMPTASITKLMTAMVVPLDSQGRLIHVGDANRKKVAGRALSGAQNANKDNRQQQISIAVAKERSFFLYSSYFVIFIDSRF